VDLTELNRILGTDTAHSLQHCVRHHCPVRAHAADGVQ
jgi:hypothetical protein